jgi:hypothetical protein
LHAPINTIGWWTYHYNIITYSWHKVTHMRFLYISHAVIYQWRDMILMRLMSYHQEYHDRYNKMKYLYLNNKMRHEYHLTAIDVIGLKCWDDYMNTTWQPLTWLIWSVGTINYHLVLVENIYYLRSCFINRMYSKILSSN